MDRKTFELLCRLRENEFVHDNPLDEVPPEILGLAKDGLLDEVELKGPSRGMAYVVSQRGSDAIEAEIRARRESRPWPRFLKWIAGKADMAVNEIITKGLAIAISVLLSVAISDCRFRASGAAPCANQLHEVFGAGGTHCRPQGCGEGDSQKFAPGHDDLLRQPAGAMGSEKKPADQEEAREGGDDAEAAPDP